MFMLLNVEEDGNPQKFFSRMLSVKELRNV